MRRKECEHICNDGTDCRPFAAFQGQGESFTQLVLGNALVVIDRPTRRLSGSRRLSLAATSMNSPLFVELVVARATGRVDSP
jgi:hypothetical protein